MSLDIRLRQREHVAVGGVGVLLGKDDRYAPGRHHVELGRAESIDDLLPDPELSVSEELLVSRQAEGVVELPMVRCAATVQVVALRRAGGQVFALVGVATSLAQLSEAGVTAAPVSNTGLLLPQSLVRLGGQISHHVEPGPAVRLVHVVGVRLAGGDAEHLAAARGGVVVEAGTVVLFAHQLALRLADASRHRDRPGAKQSPVLAATGTGHQCASGLRNHHHKNQR